MKLKFDSYLSSKTQKSVRLFVFPTGDADEFVIRREEREDDEMSATVTEYEIPDEFVVVASTFAGPAVCEAGEGEATVELFIGARASPETISAAREQECRLSSQNDNQSA